MHKGHSLAAAAPAGFLKGQTKWKELHVYFMLQLEPTTSTTHSGTAITHHISETSQFWHKIDEYSVRKSR